MREEKNGFSEIVDSIYNLPIEDRVELQSLLESNIAESRRNEMASNAKEAKSELKEGNLKFSSSIDKIKKML